MARGLYAKIGKTKVKNTLSYAACALPGGFFKLYLMLDKCVTCVILCPQ